MKLLLEAGADTEPKNNRVSFVNDLVSVLKVPPISSHLQLQFSLRSFHFMVWHTRLNSA